MGNKNDQKYQIASMQGMAKWLGSLNLGKTEGAVIKSCMERMNREWQLTLYTVSSNPQVGVTTWNWDRVSREKMVLHTIPN